MSYLTEPHTHSKSKIKVQLDFSNYATKYDLKTQQVLMHQILLGLARLKSDVDKLDIDKLKIVPIGLSNLKSKADKFDVYNMVPAPVDLSKLKKIVNMILLKRLNMIYWFKKLM